MLEEVFSGEKVVLLEEVVDESNFVCCIMDLYLSDCKWTEQSVYVF